MTTKNMKAHYVIRAKKSAEKREREQRAKQPPSQLSIENAANWERCRIENPKGYAMALAQID